MGTDFSATAGGRVVVAVGVDAFPYWEMTGPMHWRRRAGCNIHIIKQGGRAEAAAVVGGGGAPAHAIRCIVLGMGGGGGSTEPPVSAGARSSVGGSLTSSQGLDTSTDSSMAD